MLPGQTTGIFWHIFQVFRARPESYVLDLGDQETNMGVSKNMGTPKWMIYNGKIIKMDDLGVPLFLETST